jgi:23S rRNA pseudouridine2605 synthase
VSFRAKRGICFQQISQLIRRAKTHGPLGKRDRKIGLARALSKLGFCSRAQASDLVRAARVRLNGAIRRNPETPVHLGKDKLEVDGKPVAAARKVYVVINKPAGIVTTASDERGRPTVYSLLHPSLPWVAPVGRLDKESEGLLLLTNDSEWGARVSAPETHIDKIYQVQIVHGADAALLQTLQQGVTTKSGELLRAKRASVLRQEDRTTWLEIVLDEGKNRHIRRMFDNLGIKVLGLIRVAIGPLTLWGLPKGAVRLLTPAEKNFLDRAMRKASDR